MTRTSPADTPKYWFHAKRYGWGWGLPAAWQGWVVFAAYVALVVGGIRFVHAVHGDLVYGTYVVVLTAALVAICWLKGEPPGWRWGGRES
jgi:hypothetical protein